MSYRKLRVLLNTRQPHLSRIVDITSGEDLLVEDLQIRCGRDTQYAFEVSLTLKDNIEIVLAEEPIAGQPPPGSPFIVRQEERQP